MAEKARDHKREHGRLKVAVDGQYRFTSGTCHADVPTLGPRTFHVQDIPATHEHTEDSSIEATMTVQPHDVDVDGLATTEEENGQMWRWMLGPATRLRFLVNEPRQVTLRGDLWSFLDKQEIEISVDGKSVETWRDLPAQARFQREVTFPVAPGPHQVELRYRRWNGRPGDTWVALDGRALAVRAYSLRLDPK